ncbi:RsmE family RNA methyltransferase [Wolbachia pipientis]|uniref:RsmE family RNA methyltransferase n=1 Tax=Wolbachia pipientis TaxID=955 RepID=UPI0025A332F7|nr:RsmE family RNA methyltransferase [Wolbachia pipientis]MDM8335603.1 RsmE family RNA methyltransferase [Wolbachia pipientis]
MKLQSNVVEQCARDFASVNFRGLPDSQGRNFILCDETGKEKSSNKVLKNKKNIAIIVGSEGGFSYNELSLADKFCQKLSLGKRILRVDTAVVAALTFASARYITHLCGAD